MKLCVGWLCAAMLAVVNSAAFASDSGPTSHVVGNSLPADFPSIRNPYLGVPVLLGGTGTCSPPRTRLLGSPPGAVPVAIPWRVRRRPCHRLWVA